MLPFGLYELHHVGIIMPDFDDAALFMAQMELIEDYRGRVPQWNCSCIFTRAASGAAIELVVPEGGALARFNKGAGGVHHYAYRVDDIAYVTAHLAKKGIGTIKSEAIQGAGNFLCNFLSPVATRGVQIELVQPLD